MTSISNNTVSIRDLGAEHSPHDWKDYKSVLPVSEYDEGFLLKLLADRSFKDISDGPLLWVPQHAWRALAQMGRVSVICFG